MGRFPCCRGLEVASEEALAMCATVLHMSFSFQAEAFNQLSLCHQDALCPP